MASAWTFRLDQFGARRPDVVLMAPYMVYLLLLALIGAVPAQWQWAAHAVRGVGSLAVVWLFRRHLPPWGRSYWPLAIIAGLLAAWLWYAGQYWFDQVGLGGRLPFYPGTKLIADPRAALGAGRLFWLTVALRGAVAVTAVPVVEELFWRALLLRLFINWHEFERVPLGQFTWLSFIGTALLSTLQHPGNWAVSIVCWLLFNALFCWTRSLRCLVIVHAVTNLALYIQMIRMDEWAFW